MSKAIKLRNDIYIDSSGITHNRKQLKEILNEGLTKTSLYWDVPSVGSVGKLPDIV